MPSSPSDLGRYSVLRSSPGPAPNGTAASTSSTSRVAALEQRETELLAELQATRDALAAARLAAAQDALDAAARVAAGSGMAAVKAAQATTPSPTTTMELKPSGKDKKLWSSLDEGERTAAQRLGYDGASWESRSEGRSEGDQSETEAPNANANANTATATAVAVAAQQQQQQQQQRRAPLTQTSVAAGGAAGGALLSEKVGEDREKILAVVQREGLPNIISRCRSGTDAEKEKAAELLAYLAANDGQCAGFIVGAGGVVPLIAMLHSTDGAGDEDPRYDMKEVACKAIKALISGDPSNQIAIAQRGAIPPIIKILVEAHHPWTIREAAAQAVSLLAYEPCGGPAQETITELGGVGKLVGVYREGGCTEQCKRSCAQALRYLAVYKPAKLQMKELGILAPREQDPNSDVLMAGLEVEQQQAA